MASTIFCGKKFTITSEKGVCVASISIAVETESLIPLPGLNIKPNQTPHAEASKEETMKMMMVLRPIVPNCFISKLPIASTI